MTNIEKLVRFCEENDEDGTVFDVFIALIAVAGNRMRGEKSKGEILDKFTPDENKVKRISEGGWQHV